MHRIAGRIMLIDGWRRCLAAFLAGAVATLALAPFNLPVAGFLAFPVLVWLIDGAAPEPGRGWLRGSWPAFLVGWCFGFGYFATGLWWLGSAMLVDAEAFLWALPLAVLGLPAVLAVYHGLAVAFARCLWSEGGGRIFALAASLTGFEVLRGWLFTGFPWNEIGMMVAPVPVMMQSAGLVGLHGLTLAAILVFAAPAAIVGTRTLRCLVFTLAVVLTLAHLGYGTLRLATAPGDVIEDVSLTIVQPNVLQAQKWEPEQAERIFSSLIDLSRDDTPANATARRLIVWPETAFPFLITQRPDAILRLAELIEPDELLIAGATRLEETGGPDGRRFYNSVLVIDEAGGIVAGRDKLHLVPFGEYLPFQETLENLGIEQLTQLPGGFSAGAERQPVDLGTGLRMLALVCYEIIFQDEIDAAIAEDRPGFILNVTNDAWYGRTPGPYQHLAHARVTSAALGLPLVRAANSGISFVSDSVGRTVARLGLGETGSLDAPLPIAGAPTPFALYGNMPFAALLLATIAGAVAGRQKVGWQND